MRAANGFHSILWDAYRYVGASASNWNLVMPVTLCRLLVTGKGRVKAMNRFGGAGLE